MPEIQELQQAKRALEVAWSHFNYADPEFIDSAIHELNAAQLRFDALLARAKKFCLQELDETN